MRILGFMIVRDEADVVELTIRHHLALFDGIAIIDHGSTDGTSDILAALRSEGLPVFVTPDDNPRYRQRAMINALLRHAMLTAQFDWAFIVDADEFLVARDREDLERTLADCPRDRHLVLDWPTIVPPFDAGAPLAQRLRASRRVNDRGHTLGKVAVPREVLGLPGVEVVTGQHALEVVAGSIRLPPALPVAPERLELAHVPIRSADQFTVKFASGWLATVAQEHKRPVFNVQWRDAFDAIAAGEPVDERLMTAFAANYGIPRDRWREDIDRLLVPAAPFLLAEETRYDALGRPPGLGRMLKHAERLLIARR